MKKFVITISREFGSGGRLIGRQLATALGVPFYDKELIALAAEKSGLSKEFLEQSDERASSSFVLGLSAGVNAEGFFTQYDTPISDRAYFAQSSLISELAEQESSCVIVGRAAGYILREHPARVNILFHAPLESRVKRAVEDYGLDEKGLPDKITKIDKGRANFIKRYSGENWMDARSYDLCINTDKTGIDGAVALITAYLKQR